MEKISRALRDHLFSDQMWNLGEISAPPVRAATYALALVLLQARRDDAEMCVGGPPRPIAHAHLGGFRPCISQHLPDVASAERRPIAAALLSGVGSTDTMCQLAVWEPLLLLIKAHPDVIAERRANMVSIAPLRARNHEVVNSE